MPALVEALDTDKELPVDPGDEVVARFSVRNTGDDVNNFTFRVLGEPGLWPTTGIRVVGAANGGQKIAGGLPEMDLLPNDRGEVEVTFRPPEEPDTLPGLLPYGLLVCSYAARNDKREEDVEAVEEGLLNVGRFQKRAAQLLPRTSRGRFAGKHRLAVDNRGNSTATATFSAEDAENLLDVRFSPKLLVIEPGKAGFTKVKVRPRRKFPLGPPRAAPFKLFVTFLNDPVDSKAAAVGQIAPVDGLYMQRAVVPALLLPIAALMVVAVILWALFKPQAQPTAPTLAPAQAAARSNGIAANANTLTRRANALSRRAITTAHEDAVAAREQAASAASAARKDAEKNQQAAQEAKQAAQKTQQQAASATAAATAAGTKATSATQTANKALQAATPPFAGTPYSQQLALPSDCTPSCTSPQPLTSQPFAAQTFYVTDVVIGNPGGGKGTLTITLSGKPVLVEGLASPAGTQLALTTPLLLQRDQALAARMSCTQGPCTPSVFVSGFQPAKPPDPQGPDGVPSSTRLSRSCKPVASCAVLTVPAKATSYQLTDVVFQNPAGDTGAITLSRGKQALLVEGLDPSSGDVPISFTAPIALEAREKLTLTLGCRNPGGRACTAGALLVGVLRLSTAP